MKTRSQKTHGSSAKRKVGEVVAGEHLKPAILDLAKRWEADGNASREKRAAETLRRKQASQKAAAGHGKIYLAMVEVARATGEPAAYEAVALLERYKLTADKGFAKRLREIEQELYPLSPMGGELGYEADVAIVTSRWIDRLIRKGWNDEKIICHMTPSPATLRRIGWDEARIAKQVLDDTEHYLRLKQLGAEGSSLSHAAAVTAIKCRVVALSFPAAIRRVENAWREWHEQPSFFRVPFVEDYIERTVAGNWKPPYWAQNWCDLSEE